VIAKSGILFLARSWVGRHDLSGYLHAACLRPRTNLCWAHSLVERTSPRRKVKKDSHKPGLTDQRIRNRRFPAALAQVDPKRQRLSRMVSCSQLRPASCTCALVQSTDLSAEDAMGSAPRDPQPRPHRLLRTVDCSKAGRLSAVQGWQPIFVYLSSPSRREPTQSVSRMRSLANQEMW